MKIPVNLYQISLDIFNHRCCNTFQQRLIIIVMYFFCLFDMFGIFSSKTTHLEKHRRPVQFSGSISTVRTRHLGRGKMKKPTWL